MKKIMMLVMGLIFVLSGTGFLQAEEISADSQILQAVVYPASARVTRSTKVSLKEGAHTVAFKAVPPGMDENSLAVSAKGAASVLILGAGVQVRYLQESPDEKVRDLEARIQKLDDQAAALKAREEMLSQKKAFLESLKLFSAAQLPKELVTKMPSATELKETLSFVEAEFNLHGESVLGLEVQKRDLVNERKKLQNELNALRSGVSKEERILAVDLECQKAGDLEIELSYNVPQAAWSPLYEARVDFEKGKAVVSAFAVTRQTSGEDWQNVQLALSTSRPSVGGRMPELSAWHLRPAPPPRREERRVMAKSAMMAAAQYEPYYLNAEQESTVAGSAAPDVVKKAVVAYAPSVSSGVSLVYKAARPVTIKSDGSESRVPLMSQTLDAAFEYAATPKLSSYAYLKSRVTNGPADQLLAGRVNIFLDGAYVGASDIAKTIATGEEFDLYLGVDEGVTVKRELLEQKSDDTLIGSIPSAAKKIAYKYKITVENYKPRAIKVSVFDQIPVAQDDKIRIVKVDTNIKPDATKYQDREGVYLWTLPLQSREKKEIILSYVVEYPRDMKVEGLE